MTEAVETIKEGKVLDARYTLLDKLGAGGQGEVWRAHDGTRGVDIAVKVVNPAPGREEEAWAALQHEYTIASKLDHPSILKVFAPEKMGDTLMLPMELASGGDLRRLRGSGFLEIIPVLLEVSQALEHAHERGVVHRDLKPGNVLFDSRGRARLADFGVAEQAMTAVDADNAGTTAPATRDTNKHGFSPFTASPAQLRGEPPTPADDVYGLGALAYELLSGYPPYYPHFDKKRAIEERVPMLVPTRQIPPLLGTLVMNMLAKDAKRRPRSMREVIDELDASINDTLTYDFENVSPATPTGSVAIEMAAARALQERDGTSGGRRGADSSDSGTADRPVVWTPDSKDRRRSSDRRGRRREDRDPEPTQLLKDAGALEAGPTDDSAGAEERSRGQVDEPAREVDLGRRPEADAQAALGADARPRPEADTQTVLLGADARPRPEADAQTALLGADVRPRPEADAQTALLGADVRPRREADAQAAGHGAEAQPRPGTNAQAVRPGADARPRPGADAPARPGMDPRPPRAAASLSRSSADALAKIDAALERAGVTDSSGPRLGRTTPITPEAAAAIVAAARAASAQQLASRSSAPRSPAPTTTHLLPPDTPSSYLRGSSRPSSNDADSTSVLPPNQSASSNSASPSRFTDETVAVPPLTFPRASDETVAIPPLTLPRATDETVAIPPLTLPQASDETVAILPLSFPRATDETVALPPLKLPQGSPYAYLAEDDDEESSASGGSTSQAGHPAGLGGLNQEQEPPRRVPSRYWPTEGPASSLKSDDAPTSAVDSTTTAGGARPKNTDFDRTEVLGASDRTEVLGTDGPARPDNSGSYRSSRANGAGSRPSLRSGATGRRPSLRSDASGAHRSLRSDTSGTAPSPRSDASGAHTRPAPVQTQSAATGGQQASVQDEQTRPFASFGSNSTQPQRSTGTYASVLAGGGGPTVKSTADGMAGTYANPITVDTGPMHANWDIPLDGLPKVARLEPIPPRRWPWVVLGVLAGAAAAIYFWLPRFDTQALPPEVAAVVTPLQQAIASSQNGASSTGVDGAGAAANGNQADDHQTADATGAGGPGTSPNGAGAMAGAASMSGVGRSSRSAGSGTSTAGGAASGVGAAAGAGAASGATTAPGAGTASGAATAQSTATAVGAGAATASDEQRLRDMRRLFDTRVASLEARGAGVWGGHEFALAKTQAAESVGAHDAGNPRVAQEKLAAAMKLLDVVDGKAPQAFSAQVTAGEKALGAGQQEVAGQAFDLARRINPADRRASDGQRRAQNLNAVLPLLADAQNAEVSHDYARAAQDYSQALSLDPNNATARAGQARANSAFGDDNYAKVVGSGFAALGAGRLDEAHDAFVEARALKPNGAEASEGLRRVSAALTARGFASMRQRAIGLEAQERWEEADRVYEDVLAADSSLAFAQEGKARASSRADLSLRLQQLLDRPDRLSSPSVREDARSLLETARAQSPQGPVIRSQIARLEILLPSFDKPVRLSLVSDNSTQVVIPSIGSFGAFARRDIQLRPGKYTVVGTRNGFRDVRREITIAPGQENQTVRVTCSDPI